MDRSVLEEKSSLKMLGPSFSSKYGWYSYIVSSARTASKIMESLICSMKFLSPKVALYLYESTIWSWIKYCCHVWAGACCYLDMLDKLQNRHLGLLVLHLQSLSVLPVTILVGTSRKVLAYSSSTQTDFQNSVCKVLFWSTFHTAVKIAYNLSIFTLHQRR